VEALQVKFNPRRAAAHAGLAIVATVTASMIGASTASTAWAAGTNAGNATIVDPTKTGRPVLTAGGSHTIFSINLPQRAACSKDTASARFHIYGYIVPSGTNPGGLTWDANGPVLPLPAPDNDTHTLYDTTGSPYVAVNTAITTGQIPVPVPDFNWANYSLTGTVNGSQTLTLPAGPYNVGIACVTSTSTTDKFWNARLTFSANSGDRNGESWTVVPVHVPEKSRFPIALPVSAAVVLVLGLGGGVVLLRRRRRSVSADTPA
jgi:hypothetical protein